MNHSNIKDWLNPTIPNIQPMQVDPDLMDLIIRLHNLKQDLVSAEAEYSLSLKADKEFEVLKDLKTRIKELNRKVLLYTQAVNRRTEKNLLSSN